MIVVKFLKMCLIIINDRCEVFKNVVSNEWYVRCVKNVVNNKWVVLNVKRGG